MANVSWNDVLDDIKAQLTTQDDSTEYLENFNIYDYNDAQSSDYYCKTPYVMIGYGIINDGPTFLSGQTKSGINFVFRFVIDHKTTITDISESGDRLIGYILQEHKKFLRTLTFTNSGAVIVSRKDLSIIEVGSKKENNDLLYEARCQWLVEILDETL